jgi:autotransporter strand-loop-strand O-heptosyltransferase
VGEKPVDASTYSHFNDSIGNYYEPDFNDLGVQMLNVVNNYQYYKQKALEESEIIRKEFNWEHIAEIGMNTINDFLERHPKTEDNNEAIITYLDGPKVEIKGVHGKKYFVEFIDGEGKVRFSDTISNNMWTTCGIKYYIPWTIKINGEIVDKLSLEDKRVLIQFESKSIGDTIAWAPYAIELMKQKNCKVILSTFHNEWFKKLDTYKGIEFVKPGQPSKCDVIYKLGWFKDDKERWKKFDSYPNQVNLIPLQKTATDILGLDFKEVNYGVSFKIGKRPIKNKYIVFGPQSTAGCKEWVFENWVELSKMLKDIGYEIMILSLNDYKIKGVQVNTTKDWNEVMNCLYHSEFFIGLSSGLSWVNWALGKKTVMIAGFSENSHEFQNNVIRVSNDVCIKCWNDPVLVFDSGDWDWCPVYKNTERQHICQKSITPLQVFNLLPITKDK